jgi:hypothetical protein
MKTLLLAGAAILALSTAAHAAEIVNGNFRYCALDCPRNDDPLQAGSELDGWTIGSEDGGDANNAVEWVGDAKSGGWNAFSGFHSIALSGAQRGEISQEVKTVKGQKYTLTFRVAGSPKGYGKERHGGVGVTANGGPAVVYKFPDLSTSATNMGWITVRDTFVATSDLTDISLFNAGSAMQRPGERLFGLAIDDVRLSRVGPAVPEPAAWYMMILGVGMIGGVLRRRRLAAA